MGCTAGKVPMKSSNNQLDSTDIKKKNQSTHGSVRYSSCSNQGGSANCVNIQELGLNRSNKRGALQVDYINNPSQSDQITAKITRSSPNTFKKRSIDQGSWSPNMEKLKLQRLKQQQEVGIVQEKSECEEQGTNHNLYKSSQHNIHNSLSLKQRSYQSGKSSPNPVHHVQQISIIV
ncbi:hypothetical protein ABPG72_008832 [Tetrahymena utriculariae]